MQWASLKYFYKPLPPGKSGAWEMMRSGAVGDEGDHVLTTSKTQFNAV